MPWDPRKRAIERKYQGLLPNLAPNFPAELTPSQRIPSSATQSTMRCLGLWAYRRNLLHLRLLRNRVPTTRFTTRSARMRHARLTACVAALQSHLVNPAQAWRTAAAPAVNAHGNIVHGLDLLGVVFHLPRQTQNSVEWRRVFIVQSVAFCRRLVLELLPSFLEAMRGFYDEALLAIAPRMRMCFYSAILRSLF